MEETNKPHVLIAAVPIAAARLARILPGCNLTIPATSEEARRALDHERFTLAIVGVYFDGARMFELMSHIRMSALNRACPIVSVLGVRNGLPQSTLAMIQQTVNVMEGCEFLDLSALSDNELGNGVVVRRLARYLTPPAPVPPPHAIRSSVRP